MSTKPADQAVSIQNPPGFSWARAPAARGYELSLRGPDKSEQVWRTSRNWFLPDSRLKPGEYSWKVRPTTANGLWSSERRFSITGEASVFIVPSEEKLLQFIRARSRPRSLPTGDKGVDAWAAAVRAQQASAIQTLENEVRAYASKPLMEKQSVTIVPRSKDEKAWAASLSAIRNNTQAESRQLRAAALLWRLTETAFIWRKRSAR